MAEVTTHAYVGRRPGCGCMVAACIDDGDRARIAVAVADFAREGHIIERVPLTVVHADFRSCPHVNRSTEPEAGQPALPLEGSC